MSPLPEADDLLDKVGREPADLALRERAARALARAGRTEESVKVLTSTLRNLTAHEAQALPCLCKRCLDPKQAQAENGGAAYYREFAVAEGRVLFFWVPVELKRRAKGVASSVQTTLKDTLVRKAKQRRQK